MKPVTSPVYGCILASWTDGLFVHPDVVLEGNDGGGFDVIPADQYDVHSARGALVKKPYDSSGTAVDWSTYATWRATYSLLDPTAVAATYAAATYAAEAQAMAEQDFGIAPFDPVTGQLSMSTAPALQYLAGDFLSLGDVGTRPTSATQGTGIWGDKSGIYGLLNGVQQVTFRADTGAITAGAGNVSLDTNGILLAGGVAGGNMVRWWQSTVGNIIFSLNANDSGGTTGTYIRSGSLTNNSDSEFWIMSLGGSVSSAAMLELTARFNTNAEFAALTGTTGLLGLIIDGTAAPGSPAPSSLLHLKSTAPTFRMEDTTGSAKSLLLTVDANVATFEEVAGTDVLTLNLANGSVILNSAAVATNATDGFLYIAACAGVPSGTPTGVTGRVPLVADSTNNKLYIYSGGAWVALN